MRTARLIAPALARTALVAASVAHAEVPEQFRVWGGRAADHPHLQDPAPFETRDVGFSLSHAEAERGFCASRWKLPLLGSNSSSLWIVLAGQPVASSSFLAARPVGAQSFTSSPR